MKGNEKRGDCELLRKMGRRNGFAEDILGKRSLTSSVRDIESS